MFSIVICTYNPRPDLLERTLNSCLNQQTTLPFEIILIDNNSPASVNELPFINEMCAKFNLQIFTERQQGLVYARLAGLACSKHPFIIFADDDNELNADYIEKASYLVMNNSSVGVWGPGSITIDYIDGCPDWIRKHYSELFQAKKKSYAEYGSVAGWPDYYPAGSGMIVTRKVMEVFQENFLSGILSRRGRTGTSLESGEDSQIVWTAVKLGLSAGTSPELKLTHIIPGTRTSLDYLRRLNYGISKSYYSALAEMFPDLTVNFKSPGLRSTVKRLICSIYKSKGNPLFIYRDMAITGSWDKGLKEFIRQKK